MVRAEHLYIHVPFCTRRCVYCDFSIAVRAEVPSAEYVRALEMEWLTRHSTSAFELRTVYLGGGTPSKLGPEGIRRVLDLIRGRARIRHDAEVTLEANPEDVSIAAAQSWRAAGINRVSLGVQSFNDTVLRWMHRTHDAAQAEVAVQVLREVGLPNISIDLIFGIPGVVQRRWADELDRAVSLRLPHLSIYGLGVEERSPLGRWLTRGDLSAAPEDQFESEFLAAHASLTSAGFEHYEVSNFGLPGFHSAHNWAYWERAPYAGLGPAAHEFDGTRRRWNVRGYAEWARRAMAGTSTTEGDEVLNEEQARSEDVYLSLRTQRGLRWVDGEEPVTQMIHAGWANLGGDASLKLTGSGWLRLDAIAHSLTHVRSR